MPLERTHLPQERRSPANPKQTAQTAGPAKRGPSLPPKGWCWHRGAKLLVPDANPRGPAAIWFCSTCQNATALRIDNDADSGS